MLTSGEDEALQDSETRAVISRGELEMPSWFRFKRNLMFPRRAEQRAAWETAKILFSGGKRKPRATRRNTVEIPLQTWNQMCAAWEYFGR